MLPLADAWSSVARNYVRYILPGFEPAARALVALAGVEPGSEVLDIGCGPGTASLIARENGAVRVVGVDISMGMITVARERAHGLGGIEFIEGNAMDLPVRDQAFDVVISNFGVIFAPEPTRAVNEMARALKPGGRVAFTAWLPGGTTAGYYQVVGQHLPTAPTQDDHFNWGDPERAAAWLSPRFASITTTRIDVPFLAPSAEAAWEQLRSSTGRVGASYPPLSETARLRMDRDLVQYFQGFRQPDSTICWPREALVILAQRT
ncbi:MAG: methyltransferase domain-containing protein [Gemmatimonadota bacterium]